MLYLHLQKDERLTELCFIIGMCGGLSQELLHHHFEHTGIDASI